MNDYQERITAFMRYKRMNARSFGIAIGAPPQFVSLLKELTANRIQSIVKAFPELSIESVSYTHLDVYTRQNMNFMAYSLIYQSVALLFFIVPVICSLG